MEVISSIYNSGYNIKKFYLGSRELNLAYLGNQVIYDEVIGDNDLNYILYEFYGSDTLPNTVEAPVKSAILKGNTKYRDIDTGDILDTFDETKNLELVSVRMPVLTTTNGSANILIGSQLNDVTGEIETSPYGNKMIEDYILIPNADITMSSAQWLKVFFYDENKVYISNTGGGYIDSYVLNSSTIPTNAKYFRYHYSGSSYPVIRFSDGTDYITPTVGSESFKSNILTVSEDVTLRKIGSVQDEFNVLTGEVTEHIGEIVLNGSEDWVVDSDTNSTRSAFTLAHNGTMKKYEAILCDKYEPKTAKQGVAVYGYVYIGSSGINLYEEPNMSLDTFKAKLASNPITIQYPLITESIKTVDLTIVDQDGKTINKLNSFNGTTHVSTDVAENSAYPMVSLEVASELQAAMSKVAEDIESIKPVQNGIETTLDTQSNDIDSLLLATTELFEMIL